VHGGGLELDFILKFLKLEAAAGIILVIAAALAMAVANSPLAGAYNQALESHLALAPGFDKSVIHWINDGLMVVFFLLIGLELKREMHEGVLSDRSQLLLPGLAAAGGMAAPALIYAAFNWGDPAAIGGWAIPTATDIAFTLGVMSLLGPRIPLAVKIFVTTLSIVDDLGAIAVIALFYTEGLDLSMLAGALGVLGLLYLLNRMRVRHLAPYLALGVVLWVLVLKSGVHATLAGVALAAFIPMTGKDPLRSPLQTLESAIHPWVTYLILPLFAFANAGVHIIGLSPADLLQPLPLGIALGLFVGKQVGVFGTALLVLKLGWARMPEGGNMPLLYGGAILCGVGFTMSLFIGGLSFTSPEAIGLTRLGIIIGSLVSAVAGYAVLRTASRKHCRHPAEGRDPD
jgi:NhaA family Na+:H+ antiporter